MYDPFIECTLRLIMQINNKVLFMNLHNYNLCLLVEMLCMTLLSNECTLRLKPVAFAYLFMILNILSHVITLQNNSYLHNPVYNTYK